MAAPKGVKLTSRHKQKIRLSMLRVMKDPEERKRRGLSGDKNPSKRKDVRLKISKSLSGHNHYRWSGNNVSYHGLHIWVRKNLGKNPKACSSCGTKGKLNKTKWSIHWANISKKYKRKLNDWIPLCVKCHKKYDKK